MSTASKFGSLRIRRQSTTRKIFGNLGSPSLSFTRSNSTSVTTWADPPQTWVDKLDLELTDPVEYKTKAAAKCEEILLGHMERALRDIHQLLQAALEEEMYTFTFPCCIPCQYQLGRRYYRKLKSVLKDIGVTVHDNGHEQESEYIDPNDEL